MAENNNPVVLFCRHGLYVDAHVEEVEPFMAMAFLKYIAILIPGDGK